MENRPGSREENIKAGKSAGVKRRGEGLGKGPVGNRTEEFMKEHYTKEASKESEEEKPKSSSERPPASRSVLSGGGTSSGGRKKSLFPIIAIIIVIIIIFASTRSGSCSGSSSETGVSGSSGSFATTPATQAASQTPDTYGLSALLDGYNYDNYYDNYNYSSYAGNSYGYGDYSASSYGGSDYDLSSLLNAFGSNTGSAHGSYLGGVSSAKWDANTGILNTAVLQGTPDKLTQLLGGGKDTVTLMVYICGSDLESSGGAATMDIQEMLNASASDNVNILLYTGGTRQWQNNVMSSSKNQIYRIKDGNLYRVESDMGSAAMTNPDTLTSFIKYCTQNYPANRNMLVLWDHGGGSVAGYAYDEKNSTSGYMSLAGINKALRNAETHFDIIGFDTCLMATVENAIMLSNYADYLIASEEVEPGTGWYYTDWLSALAKNPSISSLELGKAVIDSFISKSASSAYGIGCTLSLTDLAELAYTVPDKLEAFADDISAMADGTSAAGDYNTIINARSSSREFGETQSLDQIDLVNFANNIGTDSGAELAEALKSAVKYNLVSDSMSYSYGISAFFPYRCAHYTSTAAKIYDEIGLTSSYINCIKKVATITGNGQSIYGYGSGSYGSGGYTSGYGSLFDALQGSNSYSGGSYSSDDISSLFNDLFFGRSLTAEDPACRFLAENRFDPSALVWTENAAGQPVITLPEDQWKLVDNITLNAFYDDGEGYIDLGADNFLQFDEEGNLIGSYNGTWLSIDDNIVPYYFDSMTYGEDTYSIAGHVPVLYNGDRAQLLLIFDSSNPKGYIAGVTTVSSDENGTVMPSKARTNLQEGDLIDFVADYYTYEGEYEDNYMIGEQWTFHNGAEIANITVDGDILALYCFTDIYNNKYWAPKIPAGN